MPIRRCDLVIISLFCTVANPGAKLVLLLNQVWQKSLELIEFVLGFLKEELCCRQRRIPAILCIPDNRCIAVFVVEENRVFVLVNRQCSPVTKFININHFFEHLLAVPPRVLDVYLRVLFGFQRAIGVDVDRELFREHDLILLAIGRRYCLPME
jgi:hypothetical protein